MSSTPTSCSRKMLLIYSVITHINNLCNIDPNMQPFLCIVGSLSLFCWPHCVYNLQCRTLTCNEELTHSGVCLWLKTNMWMLLPPLLPTCISWKCPFKRWFQRDCGKRRTCREGITRAEEEIWEIKKNFFTKSSRLRKLNIIKKVFLSMLGNKLTTCVYSLSCIFYRYSIILYTHVDLSFYFLFAVEYFLDEAGRRYSGFDRWNKMVLSKAGR